MPSGKIKVGHRDHVLGREFYKRFKLAHPEINITWNQLVEIIRESNEEIANIVVNEQAGFKLPENHGYLVVSSYKSTKKSIDLANSKKFKKKIYYLNLHTFGSRIAIRWYHNSYLTSYYPKVYKFMSCRTFARKAAASAKAGFNYLNWSRKDFIKFDKIFKLQNANNNKKWGS